MVYFSIDITLNLKNRPFAKRTSISIRETTYEAARQRAKDLLSVLDFDKDFDDCTLRLCADTEDSAYLLNSWYNFNPFTELH